jgi:hypothetical protein
VDPGDSGGTILVGSSIGEISPTSFEECAGGLAGSPDAE